MRMMRKGWVFLVLCLLANGLFAQQNYEEWISKSFDCLEKEDLIGGEACLREAMLLEPANPLNFALLTNLGTLQRRQGKKKEALLSYTAALSQHPQNVSLLSNRASLYAEMGEDDKAMSDYNALLAVEPQHQDALYERGLLFLQQRNYVLAEEDFDRLLELNDHSVQARMGFALMEKLRGNYTESERIYSYLITEMPKNWKLYEDRAELYFLMGKNARAMDDINKVFLEDEPTASLYLLRGKIKLAQYERERAVVDFEKAKEMGYAESVINELLEMAK